jgi:rhodanese-related sulfurtransferase
MTRCRLVAGLSLLSLALGVLAAPTGKIAVPEAIAGVISVDAEGLIELAERQPDLVIVDSRIHMDRRQGYIQGSISLPDVDTSCDTLGVLLADRGTPVVFYCNGVKCGRSVITAEIAKGCGYTQLYWFRGGFEEWKQKSYPYLQL